MRRADILQQASMPIASPSYPPGPYRFVNREYFIVTYVSDAEAIREALPEPLERDGSNTVLYEFIRMPDSSGFGDYTESGIVIPCCLRASTSTSPRKCISTANRRSPGAGRSGAFPRSTRNRS